MKTSTEIGSFAKIVGERKAVEYVAKAGFDAWDFSMFEMYKYKKAENRLIFSDHVLNGDGYLAFARELRKIGEDNGIYCNQSHAPFPSLWPVTKDQLLRALECTAEAGGKICVIHPDKTLSLAKNAEMFSELLLVAKQYGIKIATENMYNFDNLVDRNPVTASCSHHTDFCAHIDAVNDKDMVACLDIGHAEMRGLNTSAVEMVYALGDRLQALHIHDNDKFHDSHQIPFSMDIDFGPIIDALYKIGYKGEFTLECARYFDGCAAEDVLPRVKEMYAVVRKLADMFEGKGK